MYLLFIPSYCVHIVPSRKHHQRGKISDELRRDALYLAETYRDRALMDNDYAHDMAQETLYAQARARLAQEDKP